MKDINNPIKLFFQSADVNPDYGGHHQKIGHRFTKKLVIITKKLARHSPNLAIDSPKNWPLIRQKFGC